MFDATLDVQEYLTQASDDEIIELAKMNFRGDVAKKLLIGMNHDYNEWKLF